MATRQKDNKTKRQGVKRKCHKRQQEKDDNKTKRQEGKG